MNTEALSPAMQKAIEAGGTKNVIIGNALVKRGIFRKTEVGPFPFVPSDEFLDFEDAVMSAETVSDTREEDASNISGSFDSSLEPVSAVAAIDSLISLFGDPEDDGSRTGSAHESSDPDQVEASESRIRIDWERIGPQFSPKPLYIEAGTRDGDFEQKIRDYVERFTSARDFPITIDLNQMTVLLAGGRFGTGRMVIEKS